MNIFVLHRDAAKAAEMQCDAHVVKMILESAQMLSTAARHYGCTSDAVYKSAYVNHPCTIWTRESLLNAKWLYLHAMSLCAEYTNRYGKRHKSMKALHTAYFYLSTVVGEDEWPSASLTPFAQAMPDEYKDENPVVAYREYYGREKTKLSKFGYNKGTDMPKWLIPYLENENTDKKDIQSVSV